MKKETTTKVNTRHKSDGEKTSKYKKLTSRILIGSVSVLLLVFIIFTFVTTNFMGNDNIVTETAYRTTVADSINTTAFVIRSEQLIKDKPDGVLVYQISNGEKVKANGTIADVFRNEEDAVNYKNLRDIEEEIAELKSLNNVLGSSNVGLDSVNNRLDQKLVSFVETINKRELATVTQEQNDLLSAIYRKQIITGDQKNFDAKIEELEGQKSVLEQKSHDEIDEIISEKSGYFVSAIDGYENKFTLDSLSEIKYSDISDLSPSEIDESAYVGKVINDANWYLACPVSFEQAKAISHNDTNINIKIPYACSDLIPAKVISVNEFSKEEKAVVILECNYMSPALSQIRNEAVEIQLGSYEGLKVSKTALHDEVITKTTTDENGVKIQAESKVQGVFVKYGSELIFKQVYIKYSGEDFIICDENPSDELLFDNKTIKLYDEVVVEGDDLYDGKLID